MTTTSFKQRYNYGMYGRAQYFSNRTRPTGSKSNLSIPRPVNLPSKRSETNEECKSEAYEASWANQKPSTPPKSESTTVNNEISSLSTHEDLIDLNFKSDDEEKPETTPNEPRVINLMDTKSVLRPTANEFVPSHFMNTVQNELPKEETDNKESDLALKSTVAESEIKVGKSVNQEESFDYENEKMMDASGIQESTEIAEPIKNEAPIVQEKQCVPIVKFQKVVYIPLISLMQEQVKSEETEDCNCGKNSLRKIFVDLNSLENDMQNQDISKSVTIKL